MSWLLTDHVCANCLGRVLASEDGRQCRCADCGAEGQGKPQAICCCGIKLKGGKDAGIRCMRNPAPSAELPGEIVAAERSA